MIDILIELNKSKKDVFSGLRCVALSNCEVKDLSAFEKEEHYFMEFLIKESGAMGSKKRWDKMRAAKKRYYR